MGNITDTTIAKDKKLPGKATYLSRRLPAVYVERAKCVRSGGALMLLYRDEEREKDGATAPAREIIPVESQSIILFGPGCSVTTEAMKLITRSGCVASFCGGGGTPVFAYSVAYRNPQHKIRQYSRSTNEDNRLAIAKRLMIERAKICEGLKIKGFPILTGYDSCTSITEISAVEGAWSRKAYIFLSKLYGIPYDNKHVTYQAISLTNHFVYSLAHAAIEARGFDPNIGIIHGQTRGGGLVFDIADVYKPALSLVPALLGSAATWTPGRIKKEVLDRMASTKALDGMVDLVAELFK